MTFEEWCRLRHTRAESWPEGSWARLAFEDGGQAGYERGRREALEDAADWMEEHYGGWRDWHDEAPGDSSAAATATCRLAAKLRALAQRPQAEEERA